MWRIVQQEKADDFVLATGETHTVREFVERRSAKSGSPDRLERQRRRRKGSRRTPQDGKTWSKVDPRYFRPTEVDLLLGDPTKAREQLGWTHTTSFEGLIADMVQSDLRTVLREVGRNDRYA
jgi:GDPmannose 4,6-dehydratase